MTATGIVRPQVLLSSAAEFVLNTNELQTALNHEVAHVRRRDNLKKLLLRFVAFPGMSGLETAWFEATEMAADDAAVSNAGDALDLAAAIIKLSRLGPVEPSVDLTAALVHSPASAMNARVERLITWSEKRRVPFADIFSAVQRGCRAGDGRAPRRHLQPVAGARAHGDGVVGKVVSADLSSA